MDLTENAVQRLRETLATEGKKVPVPEDLLDMLRERFGMKAEHYASLLSMSDMEFRLYLERERHENALALVDMKKDYENAVMQHHHHWGSRLACAEIHPSDLKPRAI